MRAHRRFVPSAIALCASLGIARTSAAASPSYDPPGMLASGSGTGRADATVYAPGIRFPLEKGPAFANSQVWGHGGGSGPGGTQCDAENYSYPWHDNYCETRNWEMPLCPSGEGHQGQDVRAASCVDRTHWAVAVVDGKITNVGAYSVYLTAADGTRFEYLHMANVAVKTGDKVVRGQRMGLVSNQFDGTPTTVHLHFNVRMNVAGVGQVYVPPYASLIQAYEKLMTTAIPVDASAPDGEPGAAPAPATTDQSAPRPADDAPAENEASSDGCAIGRSSNGTPVVWTFALTAFALLSLRRKRT